MHRLSNFPTDADKLVIEKAEREEHTLWLQLYVEVSRHILQTLAEELKDDLLANANVNRVEISGDLDPIISVEIDKAQLQSYGLSLSDVEDAINNESGSSRTAVLRDKNLYLQLKASEQAYLKEEFAAIPLVTLEDGSRIRLGDVAKIDDTFDDETPMLCRFNGHASIALQVITTGLPFIFFGTLYFMGNSFAGLSLNEFTTFGFIMALGIVVDDAVVIGESIYTLRSKAGDTIENTIRGAQAVAIPTLFGVLTTVASGGLLGHFPGQRPHG
ncbi:efflux RND transporter permease subunit [Desulfobacter curvatus]|uniref:efflux RND transporter permease subunit n=1 Tax=Desulfobacter curvatus TaxID=2290 RepID=UPI0003A808B0|nr:efflux RND transporter permease subunit [Desulfobacter curvatus]